MHAYIHTRRDACIYTYLPTYIHTNIYTSLVSFVSGDESARRDPLGVQVIKVKQAVALTSCPKQHTTATRARGAHGCAGQENW